MAKKDIKSSNTTDNQNHSDHDDSYLHKINEEVYKRNMELAVLNKTLSLLRKLYQISLQTLLPSIAAEKMVGIIREDLNMETAGVFIFEEQADTLTPFSFSKSKRLFDTLKKLSFKFRDIKISNVSSRPFLQKIIKDKTFGVTENLNDIWSGLINESNLKALKEEDHLRTMMFFPLVNENKVLGILILGFNRDYKTLNEHEKDSIKSCADVIVVALDKAYLYKNLQDANEKLKSLDRLKTEFLSLASHQLRSPLTAIKGYTSMLLGGDFGDINEKQKEAVDRVFESTNHLVKTVDDLLNVSKIEQGGMQYIMAPFDMRKIVMDISADLSIVAERKGLKISFSSDDAHSYPVKGDLEKIRNVVLNLIDNSIKYTKEGSLALRLIRNNELKKILLTITDTGMGMTEDTKKTLFHKFSRGEGGKVNVGGSGLGLYLAKQIVDMHKGHVWVESPGLGKGSTFFLELDTV